MQLEDQGDWRLEVRVKEGGDGGQKEEGEGEDEGAVWEDEEENYK